MRAKPNARAPTRVAICGGGVAALEALMALRERLPIHPHIDLIAPNRAFVYQPLAVAAPFGLASTHLFELADIAKEFHAQLHVGALARVDGAARSLVLADGTRLRYDAAIVAVGARRMAWLDGALSFGGAADVDAFAELIARLDAGELQRVAFVSPPLLTWTLPLYELALLTAAHIAEQGVNGVELSVFTAEADPLSIFGAAASTMLRRQLSDRGIRLHAGARVERRTATSLQLSTGEQLQMDAVVALAQLVGPGIEGLPADTSGFIPVDDHCRVVGMEDVYAAGDGTAFAVKQGGIATQQADVAAEHIAARLGAVAQPSVFRPHLKGMLLTGLAPMYLRGSSSLTSAAGGDVAANPLWMPPTKIAGLHLGPYLTRMSTLGGRPVLEERRSSAHDAQELQAAHGEARELALTMAEADARGGDYQSALDWLDAVERLDGLLPSGYLAKRKLWKALAAG